MPDCYRNERLPRVGKRLTSHTALKGKLMTLTVWQKRAGGNWTGWSQSSLTVFSPSGLQPATQQDLPRFARTPSWHSFTSNYNRCPPSIGPDSLLQATPPSPRHDPDLTLLLIPAPPSQFLALLLNQLFGAGFLSFWRERQRSRSRLSALDDTSNNQ